MFISKKLPLLFLLALPAFTAVADQLEILAMSNEFDNWTPAFKHANDRTLLKYQPTTQPHLTTLEQTDSPTQKVDESAKRKQRMHEIEQEYAKADQSVRFHQNRAYICAETAALSGIITGGCACVFTFMKKSTEPFYEHPLIMGSLAAGGILVLYCGKHWWDHSSEENKAIAKQQELENEYFELQQPSTLNKN